MHACYKEKVVLPITPIKINSNNDNNYITTNTLLRS